MLCPRRSTPARAAASRANGAKSSGPISAAGKSHSSLNSLRHGIRSRDPIQTLLGAWLDPQQIETYALQLSTRFPPRSGYECELIAEIARLHCLLCALNSAEAALISGEIRRLGLSSPWRSVDLEGVALESLLRTGQLPRAWIGFIVRIQRRLMRRLAELFEIRSQSELEDQKISNERTPEVAENTSRTTFRSALLGRRPPLSFKHRQRSALQPAPFAAISCTRRKSFHTTLVSRAPPVEKRPARNILLILLSSLWQTRLPRLDRAVASFTSKIPRPGSVFPVCVRCTLPPEAFQPCSSGATSNGRFG